MPVSHQVIAALAVNLLSQHVVRARHPAGIAAERVVHIVVGTGALRQNDRIRRAGHPAECDARIGSAGRTAAGRDVAQIGCLHHVGQRIGARRDIRLIALERIAGTPEVFDVFNVIRRIGIAVADTAQIRHQQPRPAVGRSRRLIPYRRKHIAVLTVKSVRQPELLQVVDAGDRPALLPRPVQRRQQHPG